MMLKRNKYDFFIFILILSLSMGSIGGALQLSRLFAMLLSPYLLVRIGTAMPIIKKLFVWSVALLLYGTLSLLWTPDTSEGIKQILYLFLFLLLFFEIIVFSRYAKSPLHSISTGWLYFVIICSAIGLWELTTGNHLEIAKDRADVDNFSGVIISRFYTNATFGNFNTFVTVFCFALPWMFYMQEAQSFLKWLTSILLIIIATILTLLNASRGGVLSFAIMFLVYVLLTRLNRFSKIAGLVVLAVGTILFFNYSETLFASILARSEDGGLIDIGVRGEIWGNALKCISDSMGFGVGVGGMSASMSKYAHGGIDITHNLFLEIFVIYGFVFAFAFAVFILKMGVNSLSLKDSRKKVVLMAIIAMPIYTIINSGYLGLPQLYVHIATIYVFINYERIKYSNRPLFAIA